MKQTEEPPPSSHHNVTTNGEPHSNEKKDSGIISSILKLVSPKSDSTLRETIEEYIEDKTTDNTEESVSSHEKTLLSNILELRDQCAADVRIPRADIVAINYQTTHEELLTLLAEKQYSRLPVYKDNLDNVIGAIHVKDILATLAKGEKLNVVDLTRDVPIVSPSMHLLDLLLQMRLSRKHMVMVVDEYGGIDGLITIGDVIEVIVGEIDDEHDPDSQPEVIEKNDGTVLADAKYDLDEFEEKFGEFCTDEERDDNETLGGLVFSITGRIPARGEILNHDSGLVFEVIEADPRRISKLLIRNIDAINQDIQ